MVAVRVLWSGDGRGGGVVGTEVGLKLKLASADGRRISNLSAQIQPIELHDRPQWLQYKRLRPIPYGLQLDQLYQPDYLP